MMYPFRVLNKKKYAFCFLNAFVENICLYTMPLVLSIFLSVPFRLEKFRMLIICIVVLKVIEIGCNMLWNTKVAIQEEYNDKNAKYNATAVDFLQNIQIVKNFDALNYATNTIERRFDAVRKPMKQTYQFSSLRSDGIHFLVYFMYFVVLIQLYFQMKSGNNVFHYLVFYSTMFSALSLELKGVASLFIHYNKFKSANNQIEKMIVSEELQNKI